ncbi:MAG: cytochrome d ubiquinol oxidase subunit II [Pseudomonadota bacterium]
MTENLDWLPVAFAGMMALAMLIYAILDGYDLGVGILLPEANADEKDRMIASIGPFWDANETWLVLGVGLLLVAFPKAHGIVLSTLYLPVASMLIGLILRGVAFDFRAKAKTQTKTLWDRLFFAGSLMAAMSQGYMLGRYITGFDPSTGALGFAVLSGLCVAAGYALIGACWLIMKTEDVLQRKAIKWGRTYLLVTCVGIVSVSIVNPLVNSRIFDRWFAVPEIFWLAPVPVITAVLAILCYRSLRSLPKEGDKHCWIPFACTVGINVLAFAGLAYSFFPYIVPDQLTIWEAASATGSLLFIFYGVCVVLPAILLYTAFSYRVFWGKAVPLKYD